jgi:peptidoglycan-N-acetylglucosamine deacetylase
MHTAWRIISFLSAGRVSTRLSPRDKVLYLTFDDGPHREHTRDLNRLLQRYDAQATFFLVGSKIESQTESVRSLLDSGHRLGNHSFSHQRLTSMSVAQMRAELSRADSAIGSVDGISVHPFRPPWGQISPQQLLNCVINGDRVVLWSRDSFDYRDSAAAVVARFRAEPPVSGDVVLFHDDGAVAREALEQLLPEWRAAGFKLSAIPP